MKIKAIAPWFGGKRTLAPKIVDLLGKHTQYFEPFCGSMAVLFAKGISAHETVNDLHGDLINLARVLQDDEGADSLYSRVTRTLVSEDLLGQAQQKLSEPIDWDVFGSEGIAARAYWYFVASWMGRNGVSGTKRDNYQLAVRWTAGGGSPSTRFKSCGASIPEWHDRLRNVVILKRNALEIVERFDDQSHTAIYVDPPYLSETRSSGKYRHDFSDGEHYRLSLLLRNFKKSRIVVSYYDCPRIRELYEGWTFHDHTMNKQLHAQNGRGARVKKAPEVLITNFEVAK